MAKSKATFNKKEREKKKQKQRREKEERKKERKSNNSKGKSFEDMLAYVDEYGNISSTPPDPQRKTHINAEDIQIGVPKQEYAEASNNDRLGTVNFFNESKGYGFIKDGQTGESIFVHISALANPVKENDKVCFDVEMGPKGLNAVNVKIIV